MTAVEPTRLTEAATQAPVATAPVRGRLARGRVIQLALIGVVVVVLLSFWQLGSSEYIYQGDLALLAAIAALGLNMLTGNVGQISIGNAAFLGIGAYSVVLCQGHVPFVPTLIVAATAAGAVGLLIGLPSLRLRGLYLIFSTLALQYVASFVFQRYDTDHGAGAGHYITAPKLGSSELSDPRDWFVVLLVIVAALMLVVSNVLRGRPGRAWAAIRANEAAANVIGVNVVRSKLAAFVGSSMMIGLAGALGAYFLQGVNADYFSLSLAVSYVAMILIGGLRSVWGSVIGATIVTIIPWALSHLASSLGNSGVGPSLQHNLPFVQQIVYGALVLLVLYLRPSGVAGLWPRAWRRGGHPRQARSDEAQQ